MFAFVLLPGARAAGQTAPAAEDANVPRPWTFSGDGQLFATFDRQGGPRGHTEFRSQNWFMGMADRPLGSGTITLAGMATLEPLTVGLAGYSEIFQEGEAYRGLQVTDRQHPHDLFMQLSAAWRIPLGAASSLTVVGAPVGEAALGPVAFMHRASSAENPTPPLSHHIFDSTHVATGVVLGRVDRGPFALEGSIFRGREPDEDRYDIHVGALDSWSARVWFRPGPFMIQASHGFLHEPEQLEPGDQRRTNASVSWLRQNGGGYTAVTAAVGRIARNYSIVRSVLVEGTHRFGSNSIYSRFEDTQVETEILLFPEVVHRPHPGELVDPVRAFTAGAVREIARAKEIGVGLGADVTFYSVPPLLEFTHGEHPVSFHVFLRFARANPEARMWNMTMGSHHGAASGSGPAHHHHE